MVRFRTAVPAYAILNRISNPPMAARYPDTTIYLLENITRIQKQLNELEKENRRLLSEKERSMADFIGASKSILAVKRNAAIVANSDATLLIQGETGTGKEMLARYIHEKSRRKKGPFVKVDCSTLSRTLMESELFGHEKGAFTGATERTLGSFERAQGGTLFLDEVGNLSHETQAKLLHFLQDHTITRVGGDQPLHIDVRIIVASNTPLQDLVAQKLFRSDLFFRMDVISITLPPLRDRRDDIVELCRHFLAEFNAVHGKSLKDLSPAAYQKIYDHSWPGNIRELKNTLERAVIFCEGGIIGEELISFSLDRTGEPKRKRNPYQFAELNLDQVRQLMEKHRRNVSRVANELNMPRRTFYAKLAKLGAGIRELRGPEAG
jgi:transcriptional regulator with PAS, ATPase and Fis domain